MTTTSRSRKVGINVRGRSRRLTVNYRTTQEILALAVPTLGKAPVTGLDDRDRLADRLPLALARPPPRGARGRVARRGAGRTCRAGARVDRRGHRAARDRHRRPRRVPGRAGRAALEAEGIPTVSLAAKGKKHAVRAGTMHGGLSKTQLLIHPQVPRPRPLRKFPTRLTNTRRRLLRPVGKEVSTPNLS